jgi:hypothetical protein
MNDLDSLVESVVEEYQKKLETIIDSFILQDLI